MPNFIDLTGMRFGRLVVKAKAENIGKQICWLAKCDCGNMRIIRSNNLQSGNTHSCGCLMIETCGNRVRTHGLSSHKLFVIRDNMKARCTNPLSTSYKNYGERGITVCEKWNNNFMSFYKKKVLKEKRNE